MKQKDVIRDLLRLFLGDIYSQLKKQGIHCPQIVAKASESELGITQNDIWRLAEHADKPLSFEKLDLIRRSFDLFCECSSDLLKKMLLAIQEKSFLAISETDINSAKAFSRVYALTEQALLLLKHPENTFNPDVLVKIEALTTLCVNLDKKTQRLAQEISKLAGAALLVSD